MMDSQVNKMFVTAHENAMKLEALPQNNPEFHQNNDVVNLLQPDINCPFIFSF